MYLKNLILQKEYIVENIIEVNKDVYVDKEVIVKKIVEKPVVNPIIKRVPKEKYVDVIEEVVKPKIVEVDDYQSEDIDVQLTNTFGKVNVHEQRETMEYHKKINKTHLSEEQVSIFEESSQQVADAQAKYEMKMKELEILRKNAERADMGKIKVENHNNENLISEVKNLADTYNYESKDRQRIRNEMNTKPNIQIVDVPTEEGSQKLQSDVNLLRQKNQELQQFLMDAKKNRIENTNIKNRSEEYSKDESRSYNHTQIKTSINDQSISYESKTNNHSSIRQTSSETNQAQDSNNVELESNAQNKAERKSKWNRS